VNRQENKIKSPVVHILKEGAFEEVMNEMGTLGGQNKVPKVKNCNLFVRHLNKYIDHSVGPHVLSIIGLTF
jgi:hypothetical protein